MPNMSRRSLHSPDGTEHYTSHKHTNTDSYYEEDYSKSNSHNILKPRALFSNNNYDESQDYMVSASSYTRLIYRKITHLLVQIYTSIFTVLYYMYLKQRSWFIQIAKWIHTFTSIIMLLDTRLLKKSSISRNNKKLSSLILLLLIPFLLLGGKFIVFIYFFLMFMRHLFKIH